MVGEGVHFDAVALGTFVLEIAIWLVALSLFSAFVFVAWKIVDSPFPVVVVLLPTVATAARRFTRCRRLTFSIFLRCLAKRRRLTWVLDFTPLPKYS